MEYVIRLTRAQIKMVNKCYNRDTPCSRCHKIIPTEAPRALIMQPRSNMAGNPGTLRINSTCKTCCKIIQKAVKSTA